MTIALCRPRAAIDIRRVQWFEECLSAASVFWRMPRRCLSITVEQLIVGREELNFDGRTSRIVAMDARLEHTIESSKRYSR
jgi:hypothetical protein